MFIDMQPGAIAEVGQVYGDHGSVRRLLLRLVRSVTSSELPEPTESAETQLQRSHKRGMQAF